MQKRKITLAYGDGIGPEIMDATIQILEAAGAQLEYEVIEVGKKMFNEGYLTGIKPESWDILKKTKVFLKGPITTPQGGGFKSLNVSARKNLGLYANIRPVKAYSPYVKTHHPDMDLVIVRENEEDLYAGIEYQLTDEIVESLKLISKKGTEKIVRYAFEYAVQNGRKKVTCMTKDNIMKLADGMFRKIFNEIALEYPNIENDHKIIDIGAALIADRPEMFDVIVTLNLYGDIISDIAAQVAGSVGLMGSSNIGEQCAMFEAIHGSAPDIAGKGIANPSGLLNGAILMLQHIGQGEVANKIQNAWLKTLEDGIHTADIYNEGFSSIKVSTSEFAHAVIERLGQQPRMMNPNFSLSEMKEIVVKVKPRIPTIKTIVGYDLYIDHEASGAEMARILNTLWNEKLELKVITNRGHVVYVNGIGSNDLENHWRCRFMARTPGLSLTNADLFALVQLINDQGIEILKFETLCNFDGERAYSATPGE